jgi:hypothetical protein
MDGRIAEDLLDRLARAEVRRFVAAKDLASIGLAPVRRKSPDPAGSVEVLLEKAKKPLRVDFFAPAPLAAEQLVAARVSGRGDVLVVDASVWDDIQSFATRLKPAGAAPPTPSGKGSKAKEASPVPPAATGAKAGK